MAHTLVLPSSGVLQEMPLDTEMMEHRQHAMSTMAIGYIKIHEILNQSVERR